MPKSRNEQLGSSRHEIDSGLLARERGKISSTSNVVDDQRRSFTGAFFDAMATRNGGLPPELLEAGLEE